MPTKPKKYKKNRPIIPIAVRQAVHIEARHACIVCRTPTALIHHHINEDREDNDPGNIAYICSNCHTRTHDGEITADEMRAYKRKAGRESEELEKMAEVVQTLMGSAEVTVSSDFGQLKIKYQNLVSPYGDKLIFYQSFVYLVHEFYIDARGESLRKEVRGILGMSPEEEQRVIAHLIDLKQAKVIGGGLFVLENNQDAKTALSELISSNKIDLNDVMLKLSTL